VDDAHRIAVLRLSGELSTKARATRRRFLGQLVQNLEEALAGEGIAARVERAHERVYLVPADARAVEIAARIFGVQSISLAERVEFASLAELVAIAARRFAPDVRERSFAVRARIVGGRETAEFGARDVEVELGTALLPGARRVDLGAPEATVRVEVHRGQAHLFRTAIPGAGGLPLGTEGRAVALVSGGFDSAVAAWQLLRRGVRLEYVFCNLGGRTHELGTLRVMKWIAEMWSYGDRPRLHAFDFGPVVQELKDRSEPRYWQILLKREMMRAAERVARAVRAQAIVTGEALGQVSSQTLPNLAVISQATALPILRPLVGFHKNEIIALAEQIGTAPLSAAVGEYCGIAPRRPATAARLADVLRQEERREDAALEHAWKTSRRIDLRTFDPESELIPDLAVEKVPPGATLLDLRTREEFAEWHAEGALRLDFADALRAYPSFAKDREYVVYCAVGLKSAHLAELMCEAGLRAHHLRGGARALRGRSATNLQLIPPAG
jgi:thiamine biosynthesis protein ThiI